MRKLLGSEWVQLLVVFLLVLVPVVNGTHRVIEINLGTLAETNQSYRDHIAAALLYLICSVLFLMFVALQLSSTIRNRLSTLHTSIGWIIAPLGLIGSLAFGLMSLDQVLNVSDGKGLWLLRALLAGWAVLSLWMGIWSVLCQRIEHHQTWMIRGAVAVFALGLQELLPLLADLSVNTDLTSYLLMGGWVLLGTATELWLATRRLPSVIDFSISHHYHNGSVQS